MYIRIVTMKWLKSTQNSPTLWPSLNFIWIPVIAALMAVTVARRIYLRVINVGAFREPAS